MVIFNTTFQISEGLQEPFIEWIKNEYIPLAIHSQMLFSPLLSRVLVQEDIEGDCYARQFHVNNLENLNKWYEDYGKGLNEKLIEKFASKVVGFSTVLERIEI